MQRQGPTSKAARRPDEVAIARFSNASARADKPGPRVDAFMHVDSLMSVDPPVRGDAFRRVDAYMRVDAFARVGECRIALLLSPAAAIGQRHYTPCPAACGATFDDARGSQSQKSAF
jgi:hypothetical protein